MNKVCAEARALVRRALSERPTHYQDASR